MCGGTGSSTRPAVMDASADKNPPFATTADAVNDVGAAVDFILKRRNINKLNLIGWSSGTTIMGLYTAGNNDKVVKLVLYTPLWVLKEPPPISGPGAYRSVTKEMARSRGCEESRKRDRKKLVHRAGTTNGGPQTSPPTRWAQNEIHRLYEPPMACSRTPLNY